MKLPFFSYIVIALSTIIFYPLTAQAQIIPDRSLGLESSTVHPDVIKGMESDRVDGGAVRGSNLFHSFQEFNINQGRGAYFSNPNGIANIFSRVTGGNISQILGTLGVLGHANLYFLNPNGILFGPNAQLDMRGSFLATTADSFQFSNHYAFSAVNPTAPPLLTVNIPTGLNFRANSSAAIANQGNLKTGQDLTLTSGHLNLQGQLQAGHNLTLNAENTVKIRDSVNQAFIAAAGRDLKLQGNQSVDIFALNHPQSGFYSGGDMTLRSANQVGGDAHFWSRGNFRIEQLDGSLGTLFSPHDPIIRTEGDVTIGAYEGASLHIIAGGQVNIPGYVLITGADPQYGLQENVTLTDGTVITIDGKNEPTLDIRAGVDPSAIGIPFFEGTGNDFFYNPIDLPDTPTSADINVGTILFRDENLNKIPGKVLLTNQYQPNLALVGGINLFSTIVTPENVLNVAIEVGSPQNGGVVAIDSYDALTIRGNIDASSQNQGGEVILNSFDQISLGNLAVVDVRGNSGGNIRLWGRNIEIKEGSALIAGIAPKLGSKTAQAGNIDIKADEAINLTDSSLISNEIAAGAVGQGGNITLNTQNLSITQESTIQAINQGQGNVGSINVTATGEVTLAGAGGILNSVESSGKGNSGEINLKAQNLSVTEGFAINNTIRGQGKAGKITLTIDENANFSGMSLGGNPSGVFNTLARNATGKGGDISLTTTHLSVSDGAQLQALTRGQGDAGSLNLDIKGTALFSGVNQEWGNPSGAGTSVLATGKGNAGDITLNARVLKIEGGAQLQSLIRGQGNAGTINLTITEDTALDGVDPLTALPSGIFSTIEESTARGKGGEINLTTRNLGISNGAQLNASTSGRGDAGNVNVTARNAAVFQGIDPNYRIRSGIFSSVEPNAIGNSGNINLQTGSLTLQDGAGLVSNTAGQGNAGTITVTATGPVILNGFLSRIETSVSQGGQGNGGNVFLQADRFSATEGAQILALTRGVGKAGNVDLKIAGTTEFSGSGGGIGTTVEAGATGNGGNINVITGNLIINEGAQLIASTVSQGNAGNIAIAVNNNAWFDGVDKDGIPSGLISTVEQGGIGNSGNITLTANRLALTNGAQLLTSTRGLGNAGTLNVTAHDAMWLDGVDPQFGAPSGFFSTVSDREVIGKGGDINVTTPNLRVTGGAQIQTLTRGQGDAGVVNLNIADIASFEGFSPLVGFPNGVSGVGATVEEGAVGNGGSINLQTRQLSVTGGAGLNTSTRGQGNAGSINIIARDSIVFDGFSGVASAVQGNAIGNSGNITLQTPKLSVTNLGQIQVFTDAQGNAGTIDIISDAVRFDGFGSAATSSVRANGKGNGGAINITTNELSLTNGGQLTALTRGQGNAGNITLNVRDSAIFDNVDLDSGTPSGIFSTVEEQTAIGNGGNITLNTRNLQVTNGAQISASTVGQGNAGNIQVNASNKVDIVGVAPLTSFLNGNVGGFSSGLLTSTEQGAKGQGGNISISTPNLQLSQGGVISARSQSNFSGGNIAVNTQNLGLNRGGQIQTTAFSQGNAGNIQVNATQGINLSGQDPTFRDRVNQVSNQFGPEIAAVAINPISPESGIFANTQAGSTGNGGNIAVTTPILFLSDTAQVSAATAGTGQGGDINLQGLNQLQVDNASISASTAFGRAGSLNVQSQSIQLNNNANLAVEATEGGIAGNLTINSQNITVSNGSQVTVSSPQGQAGNLQITGNTLALNQGRLTAETGQSGTGSGANINLQLSEQLTLRNESLISATANGFANGGNVTINTPFLINYPATGENGSDIIAKAFFGNGGQITINAQGIFGTTEGKAIAGNRRNDVDASSEFGAAGVVQLNQGIDPNRGLVTLPTTVVDPNNLIAQNPCRRGKESQLTVAGRSGLPPSVTEDFSSSGIQANWVDGVSSMSKASPVQGVVSKSDSRPTIEPAQGWKFNEKGQVMLIGSNTQTMGNQRLPAPTKGCPVGGNQP